MLSLAHHLLVPSLFRGTFKGPTLIQLGFPPRLDILSLAMLDYCSGLCMVSACPLIGLYVSIIDMLWGSPCLGGALCICFGSLAIPCLGHLLDPLCLHGFFDFDPCSLDCLDNSLLLVD